MKTDRDPYPFHRVQRMARINPPVRKPGPSPQGVTPALVLKAVVFLSSVSLLAWALSQVGAVL